MNLKNTDKKPAEPQRKRKRRRKKRTGVIILRLSIILVIIIMFAAVGGILGAYMGIIESVPVINTSDVVPENYTSFIYDEDGNEVDSLHGKENREYVSLSDVPVNLQNAVVSIEDERFYSHNGIDFKGMLRALWVNIKEMSFAQGASTITQQLIKNEILSSEKLLERKIQEQYLAVEIEKQLSDTLGSKKAGKDYILELYLNSIPLNHGLNGVQAAAKFYFGKDVSELSLAECASIAGITKNPSYYSPVSYPEHNKERQELILSMMLKQGYITEEEYNEALSEDIIANLVGNATVDNEDSLHSYFVDALVVDLAERFIKEKNMSRQQAYNMIYSGGLQIYSTIDTGMQDIMEESYKNESLFPPKGNTLTVTYTISIMDKETEEQKHYSREAIVNNEDEANAFVQSVKDELLNDSNTLVLDKVTLAKSLQSAMVIMDYNTGHVKALIGGREKTGDLVFNRATQAFRQPGSCFKVLASYAPAIDLNIVMPGNVIVDEPFTYNGWTPNNWWGASYRGPSTVRQGIKDSMNILAAKTIVMVGVENSFDYLLNFGFTSLVESREVDGKIYTDKNPATSLGGITDGVSVLELTAAYATIANGGEYLKPIYYTKVLDHDGNVIFENTPKPRRVLKETTAWLLTDMMEDVITGGTGGLARFSGMTIAGKTGTTTKDVDLTFVGYTPYYVAGIWLGYDTPKSISYDKSYHLLLWKDIMSKIHANLPNKNFTQPSGIVSRSFCSISGDIPISGLCDRDYYGGSCIKSDYYAADFPSSDQTCEVHKTFRIDMSTGYLADEYSSNKDIKEIVLAIDPETGEIMNMPGKIPEGLMEIHLTECPLELRSNHRNTDDPDDSDDNDSPLYNPTLPTLPGISDDDLPNFIPDGTE